MNTGMLMIGVGTAALLALLTKPSTRAKIYDAFDPSSPVAVARTVCRAESDVGGDQYDPCIHRLVPNSANGLVNMPRQL